MCAVHGPLAHCKCGYAVALAAFVLGSALSLGCAALSSVTPADRAAGYEAEAKSIGALCEAYRFDRAAGLVADVPAMAKVCAAP